MSNPAGAPSPPWEPCLALGQQRGPPSDLTRCPRCPAAQSYEVCTPTRRVVVPQRGHRRPRAAGGSALGRYTLGRTRWTRRARLDAWRTGGGFRVLQIGLTSRRAAQRRPRVLRPDRLRPLRRHGPVTRRRTERLPGRASSPSAASTRRISSCASRRRTTPWPSPSTRPGWDCISSGEAPGRPGSPLRRRNRRSRRQVRVGRLAAARRARVPTTVCSTHRSAPPLEPGHPV